jgi:hypothetical protein
MQKILQVSRRFESILTHIKSPEVPKYLIEDFQGVEGIVPFIGPQRMVKGNLLVDRSLQKPIQVGLSRTVSAFLFWLFVHLVYTWNTESIKPFASTEDKRTPPDGF